MACLLALCGIAHAEPGVGVFIAGKLGGGFGQAVGDQGATFLGELEVGYTLPLPDPVGHDLRVFLAGQYAAPGSEGQGDADPRLPGNPEYELTLLQARLTLGVAYRIPLPTDVLRPYVAAGARMYLLRTEIQASAGGEDFGRYEETATAFGPFGALGGELYLGPGAALLEVQLGTATLDGEVYEGGSAGALDLLVGYRLFL